MQRRCWTHLWQTKSCCIFPYQNRYTDQAQYVKRFCSERLLDDIYYVKAYAVRRRALREHGRVFLGGGPLIDIGFHAIDLALWLSDGYEPAYAAGSTYDKIAKHGSKANLWGNWNRGQSDVEDGAFGFVVMKNGMTLTVDATYALNVAQGFETSVDLFGVIGGIQLREQIGTTLIHEVGGKCALLTTNYRNPLGPFAERTDETPSSREHDAFVKMLPSSETNDPTTMHGWYQESLKESMGPHKRNSLSIFRTDLTTTEGRKSMQKFEVPWGQWYARTTKVLTFPDDWEVKYCGMKHHGALTEEQVARKIDQPIGTARLEQLAAGKKSACIVIDDISRPTRGDFLLPIIIKKLVAAGMRYDCIKVLIALGGHRPLTRQEMQIKVGKWVLDHVQVLNHSPFASDLVQIPDAKQVIKINKNFMDAELRVAVGCVVPHTLAGFSGGAKAVVPGIGGIETLYSNHTLVFADRDSSMSFKTSTCDPDNAMRRNMEEIVGKVGLDFIVNIVLNDKMDIADVFAGHFIKAHRVACKAAMECLRTELVEGADIEVLSAYPKDTEYSQIGTCFAVLGHEKKRSIKPDGTIVILTAASEGAGFHSLFGPGMSLFSPHDDNIPPMELKGQETMIFSDGVTEIDVRQFYRGDPRPIYANWEQVLQRLEKKYDRKKPVVAIYPMGAIQIGNMSGK